MDDKGWSGLWFNPYFRCSCLPELHVGTIGIKEGSLTAAAGELRVEIKGNQVMEQDPMKELMQFGRHLKLFLAFKN